MLPVYLLLKIVRSVVRKRGNVQCESGDCRRCGYVSRALCVNAGCGVYWFAFHSVQDTDSPFGHSENRSVSRGIWAHRCIPESCHFSLSCHPFHFIVSLLIFQTCLLLRRPDVFCQQPSTCGDVSGCFFNE